MLAAFKGMADGISALVGHDSFGPGSLSTRSRWGQTEFLVTKNSV